MILYMSFTMKQIIFIIIYGFKFMSAFSIHIHHMKHISYILSCVLICQIITIYCHDWNIHHLNCLTTSGFSLKRYHHVSGRLMFITGVKQEFTVHHFNYDR